jgi:hypothetical protein
MKRKWLNKKCQSVRLVTHLISVFRLFLAAALIPIAGQLVVTVTASAQMIPVPGGFTCGKQTLTFSVKSLGDVAGTGIRCVKLPDNDRGLNFVWYGEGRWNGAPYRHIGYSVRDPDGTFNYSADIFGNGETAANFFRGNIDFRVVSGTWRSPREIQVTGAWNELWTLARSGLKYDPLPAPHTCGENLTQYTVRDLDRGRQGSGIRCVLDNKVWFGNGQWDGGRYAHLGILSLDNTGRFGTGEANDLCGSNFGSACNRFGAGSLIFSPGEPRGMNVTGAWHEAWR